MDQANYDNSISKSPKENFTSHDHSKEQSFLPEAYAAFELVRARLPQYAFKCPPGPYVSICFLVSTNIWTEMRYERLLLSLTSMRHLKKIKKCRIVLSESGLKHCDDNTRTVLSGFYVHQNTACCSMASICSPITPSKS